MPRPTVAELLAIAKKKRDKLQKAAIRKVERAIPPILGPGGRAAPAIARGLTEAQNRVMDAVLDQAFQDFEGMEIGGPSRPTHPRPQIQAALDAGTIGYDLDGELRDMESIASRNKLILADRAHEKRARSDKQLVNDQIQSNSLSAINKRARKKNGQLKKGWTQKKIMRLAQKECTRERERLGLCKRKRRRGKNSR